MNGDRPEGGILANRPTTVSLVVFIFHCAGNRMPPTVSFFRALSRFLPRTILLPITATMSARILELVIGLFTTDLHAFVMLSV